MSQNIELHKYVWNILVKDLKALGIEDTMTLEKILLTFGERCNNTYYLLNNEAWEEYNSYVNCSMFIDTYFHVKDSFHVFREGERLDMSQCIEDICTLLNIECEIKEQN
jgi:hypothetical protein